MPNFTQIDWNEIVEQDCREIVRLALHEDLAGQNDWTTAALVPTDRRGSADLVAREAGVVAGLPAVAVLIDQMRADLALSTAVAEGESIVEGTTLARLEGNVRDLLTAERTILNLLARLSGVATLASKYVAEVQGTGAKVYDTRKTTPGWRRLEKYAARCGGACNHRTGLYDAILIKDNHLAQRGNQPSDAARAVGDARRFLQQRDRSEFAEELLIEIEVDTLDQLAAVLPAKPDIVLLDNMAIDQLRRAVEMRNDLSPSLELEASGGVRLERIREIALTGVERVSVGALTHSAASLDMSLDWLAV